MKKMLFWFILFFIVHFIFGIKGNDLQVINFLFIIIFSLLITLITYKLVAVYKNKKIIYRFFLILLIPFLLVVSLFLLLSIIEYRYSGYFPWNRPQGTLIIHEDGNITFYNREKI